MGFRAGPWPTASRDEEGEHAEDSRDGRRAEVVERLSAAKPVARTTEAEDSSLTTALI